MIRPQRIDSGDDGTAALLTRGRAAVAANAWETALQLFDEAALREPGWADVHNLRGRCLAALNRSDEAIVAFDQAIGLNAAYEEAHTRRALLLRATGRDAEAATAMPRRAEVPHLNGNGNGNGRYPPALAADFANEHCALGDLYAREGYLVEASEQYRRACEIRPQFADIRNKLGCALIALDILEAAIRELRVALQINPEYAEARANLGFALLRTGAAAEAQREWQRCLAIQPDNDRIRHSLTMICQQLGGDGLAEEFAAAIIGEE